MRTKKNLGSADTGLLAMTALFAALTCVATMMIMIPTPTKGYVNIGDSVILTAAFLLGPLFGAAAAGIGAALADLFSGYAVYAPATLIIKALAAFAAASVYKAAGRSVKAGVLGALFGECVMAAGYFLYETMLYGTGTAALGLAGNAAQGAFSTIISAILLASFRKNAYIRKKFPDIDR